MNDDWKSLKEELERIEARKLRFGTYCGFDVDHVARVDPAYLGWCLRVLPLPPELQKSIRRALSRRSADLRSRGPRHAGNDGHKELSAVAR
jgi:hypothetical protein